MKEYDKLYDPDILSMIKQSYPLRTADPVHCSKHLPSVQKDLPSNVALILRSRWSNLDECLVPIISSIA